MSIRFAWYDLWVGAFWDRKARVLYVCPLPMLLITWKRNKVCHHELYSHDSCLPCLHPDPRRPTPGRSGK